MPNPTPIVAVVWPARLEYFSGWQALGLFALLAAPVVLLGVRSLAGLGPARKWVSIGLRLLVLLVAVLILGGIRYQRQSKDLEVMVLRDISESTGMVRDYPGKSLSSSLDQCLLATTTGRDKPPGDKVGQISFQQDASIDLLPAASLQPTGARAMRTAATGTDLAAAIQLGLATMGKDAMHRLVLVSDGNPTTGDTEAAINAAIAQHVPIDVVPLHYDVQHEVLMDRFVAPTWKRENEPFTIDVILKSTNDYPVTGKLTVTDNRVPMNLSENPAAEGMRPTRQVTLVAGSPGKPSLTPVHVRVPALRNAGVHQFHASFEADQPGADVSVGVPGGVPGGVPAGVPAGGPPGGAPGSDTLAGNNSGDAFTYVQGRGRILYVDNVPNRGGDVLAAALNAEGIEIAPADHMTPDGFPTTLIDLQSYDAVILANVPYGPGGLDEQQQQNLASYVRDLGGGLLMIGGPDAFGAGGWQGKKLEEVMPVDMDVPAQRQIPKGALVMVMHSCEFEHGNYFGEQCAIKAIETLSSRDEVGIVSYGWGAGGSQWDFPLAEKGDGSRPIAAAKRMQVGDMPDFDDAMTVALKGGGGNKGLLDSDAGQKHVIIISDGDPGPPSPALVAEYQKAKVSVSTINVYPHDLSHVAPTLVDIAKDLHGKSYGPISDNFNTLPQIFVKEATVVRRTLISENADGIALTRRPVPSDMVKGLGTTLPPVRGLVLTTRKPSEQVVVPITAGPQGDPLLASWIAGLGRAAAYTSDATNVWGVNWLSSPDYQKLWSQVVRAVARPPMSNKFDVQVTNDGGNKGHIVVEGVDKDAAFQNFLNVAGKVVGPDPTKPPIDAHLVQTGPGRYEGTFDMNDPGTYVAVMQYTGQDKESGFLPVAGIAMNQTPELRDLKSNDALLLDIANRTGGDVLPAFDLAAAGAMFSRDHLAPAVSSLPIWDRLIPVLLALILLDVAARRIAWDWVALRRYAALFTGGVRSFTTVRKVETRSTVDALQRVRTDAGDKPAGATPPPPPARPNPAAKFQSKGVEGDIGNLVGGATDKPMPKAPAKSEPPKGVQSGGSMGGLMEAKRRAQQKIKEKEEGKDQ